MEKRNLINLDSSSFTKQSVFCEAKNVCETLMPIKTTNLRTGGVFFWLLQSTPDNSNLQEKRKKFRVIEGKII